MLNLHILQGYFLLLIIFALFTELSRRYIKATQSEMKPYNITKKHVSDISSHMLNYWLHINRETNKSVAYSSLSVQGSGH